ncbi:uncharacterized protein LOC127670535 [Apodemus sylvaticus]|uniref:uncharacterized protein LOC127670535 n=1 Tax=Apodemus sylvaticus TaxID=10129 RepID=UPI002243BC8E|nr:uncharacterized protein LOC127670535 [Apodemus sylvaticus]
MAGANPSERKAKPTANIKVLGTELLKPVGTHITLQHARLLTLELQEFSLLCISDFLNSDQLISELQPLAETREQTHHMLLRLGQRNTACLPTLPVKPQPRSPAPDDRISKDLTASPRRSQKKDVAFQLTFSIGHLSPGVYPHSEVTQSPATGCHLKKSAVDKTGYLEKNDLAKQSSREATSRYSNLLSASLDTDSFDWTCSPDLPSDGSTDLDSKEAASSPGTGQTPPIPLSLGSQETRHPNVSMKQPDITTTTLFLLCCHIFLIFFLF